MCRPAASSAPLPILDPRMADEFVIERAVRTQAKLRLAVSAVSGAGKTMGSLRLAKGIVEAMIEAGQLHGTVEGKVGVVDTERNSASLYAHLYPFDRISLTAPYTVDRYLGAARALANAGKAVIIIDQISHQWAGQGGMLEFVDILRKGAKNDFAVWSDATPEQNAFMEGLLALPCHLICTMRAKTAYVLEEKTRANGSKYTAPTKVGLKPVQREGVEYEFTTVMEIELGTKMATVSKDRTGLFVDPKTLDSKRFLMTEAVGRDLAQWLLSGAPTAEAQAEATALEKATATCESGKRLMGQAMNMPDLERIAAENWKALRAFKEAVPVQELDSLCESFLLAKDQRKAILKPVPPVLSAPVISPDQAVALEQMATQAQLPVSAVLEFFDVARLSLLPAAKLAQAANWIARHGVDGGHIVPLPDCLMEAGVVLKPAQLGVAGRFDDLQDDKPW